MNLHNVIFLKTQTGEDIKDFLRAQTLILQIYVNIQHQMGPNEKGKSPQCLFWGNAALNHSVVPGLRQT